MGSVQSLSYCGGIPEIKKVADLAVTCLPDSLYIPIGLFKSVKIPYSAITNVSIKTSEQVSKDVTLGRLLLVGVLAFGVKKTSKEIINYMVIDYIDKGIETSAVFSGKNVPRAYSELLEARQKYLAANPPEPTPAAAPTDDVYSEIEKLYGLMEKGIITADEFTSKKQQLLNI
jgi:hypothetical protein